MFDVNEIRKDFPMLQNHTELIYFDNGATTFKPQCVLDAMLGYYTTYNSNVERGEYDIAVKADDAYHRARKIVSEFLCCDESEVCFLANASAALNQVAFGLGKGWLKKGDIVLTTEAEHASNLLPWYRLEKTIGIQVAYIPISNQGICDLDCLKRMMNENVKVISLAQVTNVLGGIQPIKDITEIAHQHGAFIVVDAAQSIGHQPTDVKDLDVDFLCFSSHKMCGPDGVGVLYGKKELLQEMEPMLLGGGMNARFQSNGEMELKKGPEKFETGTPNIEGVIGFGVACQYLMNIGLDTIQNVERELREYLSEKVKELDTLEIYNLENHSGPLSFNVKGIFAQDAASYLASKNIALRSGNHCAKILHEVIGVDQTLRASLYFYNTKEEIDCFVEALKEINENSVIDIFF